MNRKSLESHSSFASIALPSLPSLVRYWDTFDHEFKTLSNLNDDFYTVRHAGRDIELDFSVMPHHLIPLIKTWFISSLGEYSAATAINRLQRLLLIDRRVLEDVTRTPPEKFPQLWYRLVSEMASHEYRLASIKAVAYFFCDQNLLGWNESYKDLLWNLENPATDKFASIRTGDAFLSVDEELAMVAYLDDAAANANSLCIIDLQTAALLCCTFQFGLRPLQIASLQIKDVIFHDEVGIDAVHLTFSMVKQRAATRALTLPRKVKDEWTSIFRSFARLRNISNLTGEQRFFDVDSVDEVVRTIIESTLKILGNSRNATEFRHSAAMRLVDAGASKEELAEFMGHTDIDTGLVYYAASRSQAEKVNAALGISDIYRTVHQIAHAKFINNEELAQLKSEQQIGGTPHGIEIAGIGGCASGQPACPYNPIMSCYGCPKFMPVRDKSVHDHVLVSLRSVVKFFEKSSRTSSDSPAYLQLRRTISSVISILDEIGGTDGV